MPRVLSLSLRPRTLSGLFGQETLVKSIRQHVATRPPQTWMFFGPSGTGKTTLAWIMAASYQCTHMKLWGDPCDDCWKNRHGVAIHEINASDVNGVEELRKVAEISRFAPLGGGKRVIILDEAQMISNSAQNLLLKPLEEPPRSTIWIICTTEPEKLRNTLKRRPTTYQLKSLGFSDRERFLKKAAAYAKIERPLDDLVECAHSLGVGAPAQLLQALEKYATGVTALEAMTITDGGGANTLRICKAVTAGEWKTLRQCLLEAAPEDARWIRSSVGGWLRGVLSKESDPKSMERAATSIGELTGYAPIEDAVMLLWLWSVLFKICRRYRGA